MNIDSPDFTYANLIIMQIKRMLDKSGLEHRDFTSPELVTIALNILRIMCEIQYGEGHEDERERQMFFDASRQHDGVMFFIHHLERMSLVKNELLNEILLNTNQEDMQNFTNFIKGDGL